MRSSAKNKHSAYRCWDTPTARTDQISCPVHQELANAVQCGHRIRLSFLFNVTPQENIDLVERQWHQHYECSKHIWIDN